MYKNMPMPKPFSAEIVYFCNMSIVRAKKSLGQHFLRDQNIARKITDSLLPVTRDILEIGPGMGVLTRHLFANPAFSVRAIRNRSIICIRNYRNIRTGFYTEIF